MTTVKITELTDIGANLATSTVVPVVNMAGTPTTQKTNIGNIANIILEGAGVDYPEATVALLAQTVSNAAQPNITSVGTLTTLAVSGNAAFSNVSTLGLFGANNGFGFDFAANTQFQIQTEDGANYYNWYFDSHGSMIVPATANGEATIQSYANGGNNGSFVRFVTSSSSSLLLGTSSNNNVVINTDRKGANLKWIFDDLGNLTLPGNTFAVNYANGGAVTIPTVGNIATINLDSSNSNVLYGNGVFAPVTGGNGTYGNSDVATFLAAFGSNTITTTGNISGGNLVTGGEVVSTGNVSSGTGLSTGGFLSVDGNADLHDTSVTGNLAATGNITAINLGNISSVNLTGSNSNVLYGNGVFAAVAGGGNGTPGGSNTQIQFNDNGNFGANSGFTFDSTTGNIGIPGIIIGSNTVEIDNRASGNGADINLYSADDILIQARDRDIGSTSEGGDINIYAGDSAEDSDTSGGDITIEAGRGGASNIDYGGTGGFVSVSAGQGGNAVGANFSARPGGSLTLNAGNAGANNGNIDLGNTGGDVTINAGDTTSNGDSGGSIILRSGDAGANALAGQVQIIIPSSDEGNGGAWLFDGNGIIQLPNSGTIGNEGNNIDIGSTSAISLEASSAVNIYTDTGTNAWQWQFQDDGNLRLPTIELDVGNTINEQTVIQSQRKIIPGLRYSVVIDGSTPTTVYTATSVDTTSMKVTMQIQHSGLGFEFFDVSATSTGGNTYYTVSNRVQPPTISNSTVVVDLNGSNFMDITVTINSGAANSWVTYDATEFGIAVD
jgi:hypothetical protein